MCWPAADEFYKKFTEALKEFRIEINSLLILERDRHDRYKLIYDDHVNGMLTLVYLSSKTRQLVKIIINYNIDNSKQVIEVFSEDLKVKGVLEATSSYKAIIDNIVEIRDIVHQDRVITKLTYGI